MLRALIKAGTHRFTPENATLSVRTGRKGAAAKAGHDLLMHVSTWEGTLEVDEDSRPSRIELIADATSLRVKKGSGGAKALSDGAKTSIQGTIDKEVLRRRDISFRSTAIEDSPGSDGFEVQGDLTLVGVAKPIAFHLSVGGEDQLSASAVVVQSDWGIKPYSALFGALKVADEVRVSIEAGGQTS